MKTYEGFLLEGVGDRVGKMSDDQFNQFMKGRTEEESKTYRDARDKAKKDKDKKKSAIVVRKKEEDNAKEKTAGLGAKPRGKESFNKQRAASGPVSGTKAPLTYRSGKGLPVEKDKEKEKEDR